MTQKELVFKLLKRGINVSPNALKILSGMDDSLVDEIISAYEEVVVLEEKHIREFLEGFKRDNEPPPMPSLPDELVIERDPNGLGVEGKVDEFIRLMQYRFNKLKEILSEKMHLEPIPIAMLQGNSRRDGDRVVVIGMIMEKKYYQDRTIRIDLDDESGSIQVNFRYGSEAWELVDRIPVDSVVAIRGVYYRGRITGERVYLPDLNGKERSKAEVPVKVALISDLHIGSKYFNEKALNRFLDWLKSEEARDVKYLIIGGDLIDGIGVYPNQEEELLIPDVYKQYEKAATLLERIPDRVKVIYIPGNHEPVRQAEPQPKVPKKYVEPLLEAIPDMIMLGNPAVFKILGVRFYVYHGRSLNAIFKHIPGLQPVKPNTVVESMEWLIKLRHLAPIWGEHPIAPEVTDWLVMDLVPDVLHTGHIHVYGVGEYKGVKVVNSGTFEEETPYIKSLGIKVTVGKVPIVDLSNLEIKIKDFREGAPYS